MVVRARDLLVLAVLASAARAEVIEVDPAGGSGVEALTAALASALPGDVLLLQPGVYSGAVPPFEIHVGVTLLPASGAGRVTLGAIEVSGLPAGQTVVLRGFDIVHGPLPLWHGTLHVIESPGTVWVEDCTVNGFDGADAPGSIGGPVGSAVHVEQGEVLLRHCTLQGGQGAGAHVGSLDYSGSGGHALRAEAFAVVTLHDCTLVGGEQGAGQSYFEGGFGGHALSVTASDVTAAGCTLQGGAEGAGNDPWPSSKSGSAVWSWLAASDVRLLECTLAAGPVQGSGIQGPVIDDVLQQVQLLEEPARTVALPDQLREGESGVLQVDGEPGDLALVIFALGADLTPLKGQEGTLATQLATLQGPLVLATLSGPDGHFELPFQLPELPASLEAVTVYVQGVFKDGDGSSLGGASALTWIDSAF